MVDCGKLFLPYHIQDMLPLLTNRPISKENEFEIERINKENILFVSSIKERITDRLKINSFLLWKVKY